VGHPLTESNMFKGREHLRKAREVLNDRTLETREGLRIAAKEFWSAYFYVRMWSLPLWVKADELVEKILQHGSSIRRW
jgi:hypothetical protein